MNSEQLPFEGLKVIDCASYVAGPAAATILSDFGADVIKVEPIEGDPLRVLFRGAGFGPEGRNYGWELSSRNKRSLAIDLKNPQGLAALHRLVVGADVFITNLPLAARQRLGIEHETITALNPRLIYASFTAFGETGAEAGKTGFDTSAYWARSGLMDLVRPDHRSDPARSVAGMGDHPSAMTLFAAITTALYRRERTGKGGRVSSSLLANGIWANGCMVQASLFNAPVPPRPPREESPAPLTSIYRCRDGRWLQLVLLNEARQLEPLLTALGISDLLHDPRFANPESRPAHAKEFIAILDDCFAQSDLAEWCSRLDAAGITFSAVSTLNDIHQDAQILEIGALVPFQEGPGLTVSSPFALEGIAKVAPGKAPDIGEHNEQILREAGYDARQIGEMKAGGVITG